MKHKHADIASAWMQNMDLEIQMKTSFGVWVDNPEPSWSEECEYRFKPETKPDTVGWLYVGSSKNGKPTAYYRANGETGELKSVRKIGSPCPVRMEALLWLMLDNGTGFRSEIKEALRND